MKTLKKTLSFFGWIILYFLIFSITECQAQLKQMSARDLTQESTDILYGKCSDIKSEWDNEQNIIYTYITVIPEAFVKGNQNPEIVITVPGGRVGNIIYEVSEMPVFEPGEEVFTFLWKHPSGKNLVTGGYLGKLKIEKDRITGERMISRSIPPSEDQPAKLKSLDTTTPETDVVLLEDFINEVKGYLK
jgi:hypothetical protein